jgi:mannosyl-3-phosphoglycerate phosphatase family protein
MTKRILFTDLDGTLLDYSTYSFENASPALELLRRRDIPLILSSSKTKGEIEHYRRKLANHHPFIAENGGGIFIPKNYFDPAPLSLPFEVFEETAYSVVRLGAKYEDLRNALESLRSRGFRVRGFGDMTVEEISKISGLSLFEAALSKERHFDEPFIFEGDEADARGLLAEITALGFRSTRGRFFHILGDSDKGKAVSLLTGLFRNRFGPVVTIALGDSLNDLPMLEAVDVPVVVQKKDGTYEPEMDVPNLIRAEGIGPEGWNRAVLALISGTPISEP